MPALAPVLNPPPSDGEVVSVALPVSAVPASEVPEVLEASAAEVSDVVDAKSEECHRMGMPMAFAAAPLAVDFSQSPPTVDTEKITSTVSGITMVQRSVVYQGQPVSVWQENELDHRQHHLLQSTTMPSHLGQHVALVSPPDVELHAISNPLGHIPGE